MIAIFIFYNEATGKQRRWIIDKEFLHCNVMINKGDGFLSLELTSQCMEHHQVPAKKTDTILRNLKRLPSIIAIVCVWRDKKPAVKWFPLGIKSCNEFSRVAVGVDIPFTFNPIHLYRNLLKYDRKRNYEVLYHWRRKE